MDLSDPTRALTPTLDGPVLAVLARAGRPLTVGEIALQASRGSEIGIRRAVSRLVSQGIVIAEQMGRNQVHHLNREHLAAPAADTLASLRGELWRRLREAIESWKVLPIHAAVFGSAARRDGNAESDIDLVLVRRQYLGERPAQHGRRPGLLDALAAGAELLTASHPPTVTRRMSGTDRQTWESQVDALRAHVQRWTGNRLHVVDLTWTEWAGLGNFEPNLHAEITSDSVSIFTTIGAGHP